MTIVFEPQPERLGESTRTRDAERRLCLPGKPPKCAHPSLTLERLGGTKERRHGAIVDLTDDVGAGVHSVVAVGV